MNRTFRIASVILGFVTAAAAASSPNWPMLTAHAVPNSSAEAVALVQLSSLDELADQAVSTNSEVAPEQVEVSQQDALTDQAAPDVSEMTLELAQVALANQAVSDLSEVSVELAQLSPRDLLVNQMKRYERQIEAFALKVVRENSPSSSLDWVSAVTDFDIRRGELKVTVYGSAPRIFGRRKTRLTIYFKLNRSLAFEYDRFHLHVSHCGSRIRIACRRARRRASRRIDAAIRRNETAIENEVTRVARQLLRPFFQNRSQLPTELSDRV